MDGWVLWRWSGPGLTTLEEGSVIWAVLIRTRRCVQEVERGRRPFPSSLIDRLLAGQCVCRPFFLPCSLRNGQLTDCTATFRLEGRTV